MAIGLHDRAREERERANRAVPTFTRDEMQGIADRLATPRKRSIKAKAKSGPKAGRKK